MHFILASSSPNRAEMLHRMGVAFRQVPPPYEEEICPRTHPVQQVQTFALGKAESVYPQFADEKDVLILGCDSMINFEGRAIGKAKTKKEAFDMLASFRGKTQTVETGIALVGNLRGKKFSRTASESSRVKFRADTTNCQIRRYLEFPYGPDISTPDWKNKCGAYSILGTGIFLLESIEGDFQNIIGIPVLKLGELIREVTGKNPLRVFEPRNDE